MECVAPKAVESCQWCDVSFSDPQCQYLFCGINVYSCIEGCHGIIVLGLERSHAYFYRDKEGSEKESEAMHRRYSSAWLQLETGMAIGMGKDIFVLCQKNLYGDGIFDRNWNSYTPVELEMPLDINDPMIKETLRVLESYKKEIEANK